MAKILTVDPGVYTMGVCLWDEDRWYSDHIALPERVVNYEMKDNLRKVTDPMDVMSMSVQSLRSWFEDEQVSLCYVEKPQIWTSARGMAGAIKGHVLQLEMFRGMLFSMCKEFDAEFKNVNILMWKGQMSKLMVVNRLKGIIISHNVKWSIQEHMTKLGNDWDALGMGLYLQGYF